MKRKDYSEFNIIQFLEDQEIFHRFSGENVGKNYVGFRCPWCSGEKEHGGVHLTHKHFSCWQCGESASPPKLVKQILNCFWAEAYYTVENYSLKDREAPRISASLTTKRSVKAVTLPAATQYLVGPGSLYLQSRGFDPEIIAKKYGVKETGPIGDDRFRLVIPIYIDGQLVSYTTRDYTSRTSRQASTSFGCSIEI